MNNLSETISGFLAFLRESETAYNIAVSIEHEMDNLSQDLLHSLELESHTYHEYAKISKQLSQTRQSRRTAKDTAERLRPIVDYIAEKQEVIKSLERLLGEVRKAEKKQENRYYVPKSKEARE